MVILLSTRGTAGSDIWFMCLPDKAMVRSYHLRDYDWTPLSQNLAQKCNDTVCISMLAGNDMPGSTVPRRPVQAKPPQYDSSQVRTSALVCRKSINHVQCRDAKSFVDDLGLCRGVVLSRAAASLRSIETKPFDREICPQQTDTSLLITSERGGVGRLASCLPLARCRPKGEPIVPIVCLSEWERARERSIESKREGEGEPVPVTFGVSEKKWKLAKSLLIEFGARAKKKGNDHFCVGQSGSESKNNKKDHFLAFLDGNERVVSA